MVDWDFCPKQVGFIYSREDGKKIICEGEKTKRLEIFLNIDKWARSNSSFCCVQLRQFYSMKFSHL